MTEANSLDTRNPLEPFVLDEHRLLVGDLVLDLALRTIHSRSMRSVKLSCNEFIILTLLTKSPGRFISKEELLAAVAGHEIDPHHSIVDTYITYLHRLLQEADSSATIEKAAGVGFRLRP
jgi:DNA-binding response OmpR family regulator